MNNIIKIEGKNLFQTSLNSKVYKPIRININKITTPKIASFNNQITTNNKSLILELSSSSNRNNKESSRIKYNSNTIPVNKRRIKNYKVRVIKDWESKNGFNTNNLKEKSLVQDKIYQIRKN